MNPVSSPVQGSIFLMVLGTTCNHLFNDLSVSSLSPSPLGAGGQLAASGSGISSLCNISKGYLAHVAWKALTTGDLT